MFAMDFAWEHVHYVHIAGIKKSHLLLTRSRAELESTASRWLLAEDRPRVGNAGARDGSKNSWLR